MFDSDRIEQPERERLDDSEPKPLADYLLRLVNEIEMVKGNPESIACILGFLRAEAAKVSHGGQLSVHDFDYLTRDTWRYYSNINPQLYKGDTQ